ncbi:MAG TPA: 30S ribosomal protein S20 [Bacteroidales bacterium]|jgi:small subunit ribosomal protein S20|nr:30S ribosomal protein S20 [Bacteroidales bacterium]MDX9906371.1 30S ribosomal protein S20 [Bacteroidales bacterium]HNQ83908.1 30S ribosomal protein S20 [Bacteroidales bacterium]HOX76417.1 30S ribosomal protein S20 [Bacteroidales bacterium]HPM93698.1 30S ribosomal protein S20 [Bacteroidales bacterium]
MANHKSALKRIRANENRKIQNRYHGKTMRNAIKKFRSIEAKEEATAQLPKLVSMIDKMAKRAVIHKNKAANLKSKLTRKVNAIA